MRLRCAWLSLALLLSTGWATAQDADQLFQDGVQSFRRGDTAAATESFKAVLATNPGHADAFRMLRRNQRKWIVTDPNFCVVDVDIPKGDPTAGTVKFTSILATGKQGAQSETTLSTFGSTKRRRAFK